MTKTQICQSQTLFFYPRAISSSTSKMGASRPTAVTSTAHASTPPRRRFRRHPPPPHTMAQCVMSSVAGVRASVPVPRSTRVSQPRKLNGPRVVTARAITQTVAETPNANAALYDQFKALLVDYEFSYKIGDRVSGKVFHCDSKGAWVDIGAKAAALCPAEESSLADVRNVSSYLFDFRSPDFGDRWR